MYGNERLVKLAATKEPFLRVKGPRDPRVLEALGRVDRRMFLDDEPMPLIYVNPNIFSQMCQGWMEIEEGIKKQESRIIVPSASESDLMPIYGRILLHSSQLAKTFQEFEIPISALAYNDITLPIGYEQSCSQPSLIALICDLLELKEGQNVLEIGSGCGYHAAVTAELVGRNGKVTSIEIIQELATKARENLERYFGCQDSRVGVICKDGSKGHHESAPYDRIYLTAGVKIGSFDPDYFIDQLNKADGRFLFPDSEQFNLYTIKDNELTTEVMGNVRFVELQGENS